MILISACLAGVNCKYNGENNLNEGIKRLIEDRKAILVCPEQLGGLATPRVPAEIVKGEGKDVLEGKCKVMNKDGEDKTNYFIKGAKEALEIAKMYHIKKAILKERSPSCGCGIIYDGSFKGNKRNGDGVTTALFNQHGIKVYNENNYIHGEF
ncbi:DUF523 domain-containing protein [Lutibacter sp. B2]|nr:DUF523 domain-containing protein [Lutibacter sp. B2]